jgi:hypothetical protein
VAIVEAEPVDGLSSSGEEGRTGDSSPVNDVAGERSELRNGGEWI